MAHRQPIGSSLQLKRNLFRHEGFPPSPIRNDNLLRNDNLSGHEFANEGKICLGCAMIRSNRPRRRFNRYVKILIISLFVVGISKQKNGISRQFHSYILLRKYI